MRNAYAQDETRFTSLVLDALMEATTRKWQEQPRHRGPDLCEINGFTVPEYLTRPTKAYFDAEPPAVSDDADDADDDRFNKVDKDFATVADLQDDALIKLRNAARAGTKANREMDAADEAMRRARGNASALLRDIADAPTVTARKQKPHEGKQQGL